MLAESYERIHRSNLVGMGVIPLEYLPGVTAETLGLTGRERYSVVVPELLEPRMLVDVKVRRRHRFGRGQNVTWNSMAHFPPLLCVAQERRKVSH